MVSINHQSGRRWVVFFLWQLSSTFLASFSNPLYFFRQIQMISRNIVIRITMMLALMLKSSCRGQSQAVTLSMMSLETRQVSTLSEVASQDRFTRSRQLPYMSILKVLRVESSDCKVRVGFSSTREYLDSFPASTVYRKVFSGVGWTKKVSRAGRVISDWVSKVYGSLFLRVFQNTCMFLCEQMMQYLSPTNKSFRQLAWKIGSTFLYLGCPVFFQMYRQASTIELWPWFWHSSTKWSCSIASNDSHPFWVIITLDLLGSSRSVQITPIQASSRQTI